MARTPWGATEFLDTLATEATRSNYRSGLKLYFTITTRKKIPKRDYERQLNEISINYFKTNPNYEKDLVNFHKELKKNYAPKTVELRMLPIRGLFEFNEIKINNAILTKLNGRKTVEPISEEKVPRREEVKLILQHLPLHMKSYALFLLSGGLRPGEPLTLELTDLEQEEDLTKVYLKSRGTKSGRKRWSYISPEATQVYRLWLDSRDQFIELTANAIPSKTKQEKYLEKSREKVFPFSYNTANKVWVTAVKKAGLLERDEETGRVTIRLHNLRKYFSTRGKWSDKDIPDFLQGHISGVRAVYNRYDQAEQAVKEAYLKAVPSLTIEEYADTGKVEELESIIAENKQQSLIINDNINFLVSENRQFKERVKALETESRLQQLEFKEKTRQLETQIDNLRQGLMQVTVSGIRVLPSRVMVTGETQLEEYLKQGYEVEAELPPESSKQSVSDEIWETPSGDVLGEGEKVYASINQNGIELRGNPNQLKDIEEELVKLGVTLDKMESEKRYLLHKKGKS